jgi:TrmH family RNA methyltransferase
LCPLITGMTITSHQNQKLKEIRKLNQRRRARAQAGRFVAEGEDLLEAADRAGWIPVERYSAEGSGLPGTPVTPELLAAASELGSGTRTLAVYEERWQPSVPGPLAVYLHGVSDPGNVGAILRSAEAFGASCVVLGPRSADPYGPKAVRASMGAIFTVPVTRATLAALPGTTIALASGAEETLAEIDVQGEVCLLVGAERTGLPPELAAAADRRARIPIDNHSLNAAMAATVALYELRRIPRS